MFQNKIRTKFKQNVESKKSNPKKYLKLHKIEERNQEKIELMKEKINLIQEKLSLFKGPKTTKNKKKSRNKEKLERKISIEENQEKIIKGKDLLSTINISPNCQHIDDFKFPYQSYSNNFYNICKEKPLNDSKNCFSSDKDYMTKKRKENNCKSSINNSKKYNSSYGDKNSKLKTKDNYSVDKENSSLEKNTKLFSIDLYDKFTTNKNKKDSIHPYKKSPIKNRNDNKSNEFSLLNVIKPNKSNSFTKQKTEREENLFVEANKDNHIQNKYPVLEQLGTKNIVSISKETPSTRNTLKNEIKISENIISNKYNKISNKNEATKCSNKKDSLNKSINKNETSKKIRIMRCLSKRNIIDKKIKKKNNRSFEYKAKQNLNLTQLKTSSTNIKNKISNVSKKTKKVSTFSEKNFFTTISPPNITSKTTKNNIAKNIITLRKATLNCRIELPFENLNTKKNQKIKFDLNNKPNKKILKKKKHSSFDLSKTKIYNFEEKFKNKQIKLHKKLKTEKHSKKDINKSCENLNVFNFKTIKDNFNDNEKKEEIQKVIPHVFSVILKRKGLQQKEYPNMALKMNSSQGNIAIRKSPNPVFKEMKLIKEMDYICKKGFAGPGIKKTNQDNYFIFKYFLNNNNYSYIGVCDGHGILGQDISSYLVNNLPQNLNNDLLNQNIKNISSEKLENISKYIDSSFIQTNIKLNTDERIDSTFSGSTCSSLIYSPKKIITINVGDSRCILGKYNNEKWFPKILTRDHKPNEPDELDRIISSGGKVEPLKDPYGNFVGPERVWKKEGDVPGLAMSRSFGDEVGHEVGVIVNPEIKDYEFVNEDKFIVVASDGIWEFISNEEVIDIVKDFYLIDDIKGALNFLYKEASKRWIMEEEIIDDITIVLIFLN